MSLPKRYDPNTAEPRLHGRWQEKGVYHFRPEADGRVYSIDTPPPTVSGHLHLGHVYSYSHTDFMARFWRMNGRNVYYPMGYDDNGLPTERLVEKWEGVKAADIGRRAFVERCLAVSEEAEKAYQALWQRLGLSIDWRYTYRTIDERSQRISQLSFLDLYHKDLVYRQQAPTIWCPECETAIAQAEVNDLQRESTFYTLDFRLENGETLAIATTRPELLPACVAVFIHPEDSRFQHLVGQRAAVPLFGQQVPILADPGADPQKGTGVVMCCTFGDTADVEWWYTHKLPLVEAIAGDGRMTAAAGDFANLPLAEARRQIVQALDEHGLLLERRPVEQTVRVHERCDTPVEYIVTRQWFVRVLDFKEEFLAAGEHINWYPEHMKARYRQWVENLGWDWCISRQRTFGITFPIWYCDDCGTIITADEDELPVDPTERPPSRACTCGSTRFTPEADVMDTWATSSLTPQIVGQWLTNETLYQQVFPFSLRPQAHEIIRTWAFYTIVKSHHHFGAIPFETVTISGWGLAPEGTGKISKSRGGGPVAPMAMIEQYSADAVRYWAASTGFGKDAVISEEKIQAGAKLVTKLWNMARFSERFIGDWGLEVGPFGFAQGKDWGLGIGDSIANRQWLSFFTPGDRWILARTQQVVERVTGLFHNYDYATAKSEIEVFFWRDLADNYLEMAKKRLYDGSDEAAGATYALYQALLATLKLLAPFLPYVTEEIYTGLFAKRDGSDSIHTSRWPQVDETWLDEKAIATGELLVEIATAVRRYKSEHNLSLGAEVAQLQVATADPALAEMLKGATADLTSITRAREVSVSQAPANGLTSVLETEALKVELLQ